MSLMHTQAVIANGEADSTVIDVQDQVIVSIHMSEDWTAGDLAIHGSITQDGTFYPVTDAAGTPLVLTVVADTIVAVAPDATRGLKFVQLVSSVSQGAARTLHVGTVQDDRA